MKNKEIKLDLFLTRKDCGDGSITIGLFKTRKECLERLNRTEEQLENGSPYDDGTIDEVSITLELIDGVPSLKEGFYENLNM